MYKVIGADQKEYGPVTSDQIRKWIADGRANAETQVQAEGTSEWHPLSAFPEFAQALGMGEPTAAAPPPAPSDGERRAVALRRIKGPAIALMVASSISAIWVLAAMVWRLVSPPNLEELNSQLEQMNNPQLQQLFQKFFALVYGPLGIVLDLFELALAVLILMGALRMRALRSYEFSITAAILAMVPCFTPCCGWVLGLPFGIWALVVLRAAEVKSQFH